MKKIRSLLLCCLLLAVCLVPLAACGNDGGSTNGGNSNGRYENGAGRLVYDYKYERYESQYSGGGGYRLTILFDPFTILQDEYYYLEIYPSHFQRYECMSLEELLKNEDFPTNNGSTYAIAPQQNRQVTYLLADDSYRGERLYCIVLYATERNKDTEFDYLNYLDIIYFE